MPELTPIERLQPCLLDRLTDDDPKNASESRNQRVVSLQRYKQGVLRDLEWLFNTSAHRQEEDGDRCNLGDFPEAYASVINFGTRQLSGLFVPTLAELEEQLNEAIRLFEPRIIRQSLSVKATVEHHTIHFEICGELWAHPIPEQLYIKTKLDLETGRCVMGDRADG